MTDAVRHALTVHAFITGPSRGGQVSQLTPNVFAGTVGLCDDIATAIGKAFEHTMEMRTARAAADLDTMATARSHLAVTLAEATRMTASLGQVLAWHEAHQMTGGKS